MAPGTLFRFRIGNRKIDLAFKHVHARDEDANFISDGISAIGAAADESALNRIETIKIVAQRGNVDYAGDKRVRQLNHQAVISNVHYRCPKNLWIAFLQLLLKKLKLL